MSTSSPARPINSQEDSSPAEIVLLDAVRSILLKQDRETLRGLEDRLNRIEQYQKSGDEALHDEIQGVIDQLIERHFPGIRHDGLNRSFPTLRLPDEHIYQKE